MAVPPPFPAPGGEPAGKPALRVALRSARAEFAARVTPDMLATLEKRIGEAVGDTRLLGGYVAHRGEPDVRPALARAMTSGTRIALPRMGEDGAMGFVSWDGVAPLTAGAYGIGAPPAGGAVVPDVLLVPLLGFDRSGNRLGQGGGHYDRWLDRHRATVAIGVAWSVQEVPALAAEPWDMPLRLIVTEAETIAP